VVDVVNRATTGGDDLEVLLDQARNLALVDVGIDEDHDLVLAHGYCPTSFGLAATGRSRGRRA